MVKGKLIVLEGVDAVGKKTQALMLVDRFLREGKRAEYVHFPTYQATRFGDLIARYLRGEFGPKEATPPEVGCLLYALDRYQFKESYEKKLAQGVIIVADRYTHSNIFQAAKAKNDAEAFKVEKWLEEVEARMPQPDITILFDAPPGFSSQQAGLRGASTGQKKDIHEQDVKYLARVRSLYCKVAKKEEWPMVEVVRGTKGKWLFRPREEIHAELWQLLKKKGLA